ncbi:MAG: hypothetical protein NEHIOOID_00891 [Holosporales bacterium]
MIYTPFPSFFENGKRIFQTIFKLKFAEIFHLGFYQNEWQYNRTCLVFFIFASIFIQQEHEILYSIKGVFNNGACNYRNV